jgi:hypothetical protein
MESSGMSARVEAAIFGAMLTLILFGDAIVMWLSP